MLSASAVSHAMVGALGARRATVPMSTCRTPACDRPQVSLLTRSGTGVNVTRAAAMLAAHACTPAPAARASRARVPAFNGASIRPGSEAATVPGATG